jgi:hypothetical protein
LLGVFLKSEFRLATYRFVEPVASLARHLTQTYGPYANANRLRRYPGARYAVLLDVVEHMEDDRAFLADVIGRLDAGTTVFITVPALPLLWSSWDEALGHHRRYLKRSMRRLMDGLPVRIRELSYLFPEMVPVGLVRKLTRQAQAASQPSHESALFPVLPRAANNLLYFGGLPALKLRRLSPLGSSLLTVLEVT